MNRDSKHSQFHIIQFAPRTEECNCFSFLLRTVYILINFKIFSLHSKKRVKWKGACLDTRVQTAVIRLKQENAYCRFMRTNFKPTKRKYTYSFGNDYQTSLGSTFISIFIFRQPFIIEKIEIVDTYVPSVLGLDVLNKYVINLDNVRNMLFRNKMKLKTPLV